jgi:hypothetical protein
MDLSAHVWKFVAACANEEDDMKKTKTTGCYILKWLVGIKDLETLSCKLILARFSVRLKF